MNSLAFTAPFSIVFLVLNMRNSLWTDPLLRWVNPHLWRLSGHLDRNRGDRSCLCSRTHRMSDPYKTSPVITASRDNPTGHSAVEFIQIVLGDGFHADI